MSEHVELIARARKSDRNLSGVIVVSPKLVAELADALEAAGAPNLTGQAPRLRPGHARHRWSAVRSHSSTGSSGWTTLRPPTEEKSPKTPSRDPGREHQSG